MTTLEAQHEVITNLILENEKLKRERDEAREALEAVNALEEMHAKPGSMEIAIKQNPAQAQWVAKCFASMVAASPNYTEMKFDLVAEGEKLEWLTVLIQKGNGKTPHQLRQEAEKERDEAREDARTLADATKRLLKQCNEAREEWGKASMDAAQLLSEKTKVLAERDEARDIAEELSKQGLDMMDENRSLKKKRDEAIADRDIARLAALESDKAHDRMVGELEKVYKERDEAYATAEKWKELCDAKDELFKKGIAEVERERNELRALLVNVINDGTDGKSIESVSIEFLRHVPSECESVKRERDEARKALMEIEDRCVDCEDACDDIQKIREIAVKVL